MDTAGRPNGRQKIQIAERAAVALRSVDTYVDGKRPLRANTVAHIERALRELDLHCFIRASGVSAARMI